jgi:glutathione S-transferase
MYILHIANKNYSSWSLRPWLVMRECGIAFQERLTPFAQGSSFDEFRTFSPTGKVPCLVDADTVVWDSLGITEYLAERHPDIWPQDRLARAWARSAAAEMHSGFTALRTHCTINCGIRVRLHSIPAELAFDLQRLAELWSEGLTRFGGPFLAGARFTAVDAFFAPVALRAQTYGLDFPPLAGAYAQRLTSLPEMQRWYQAALAETWREPSHEAEAHAVGTVLEDLRAR